MDIEIFHNQIALHLGYKCILNRNIDIHIDDSKDEIWITIEVKKPAMMIRFNPSVAPATAIWIEQISEEQKGMLCDSNLEPQIQDLINKILLAYTNAIKMRF